jgi:hypothetical protein
MAYQFTAASTQRLSTASSPLAGNVYPYTLACWFRQETLATGLMLTMNSPSSSYVGIAILAAGNVRALDALAINSAADTTTTASASSWHHACGIFSASNSRTAYLNAGGATTNTNTSGTSLTGANEILVGARRVSGDLGTYYTGLIAECGIWNAALTQPEIASLAKGMTCDKVRPQSLVFYAPLVRDLIDAKGGLTITNNNGATVANHPRVYA